MIRYKNWIGKVLLFPLIFICIFAGNIAAQSSANYAIQKWVIDQGGTISQSNNFEQINAIGQPSPIGFMSSANFALSAGFLAEEAGPVANFGANPTTGDRPLTVQFADSSTGLITSRLWDFGDGENSTEQNPVHTYDSTGTFTVKLTVTGPGGSDEEIKNNYITVSADASLVANFSAEPTSGIRPLTVQFTDKSAGNITSYNWNFGDGVTSSLQSPEHIYNSVGLFTVSLTVTGHGGTDTKMDSISVFEAEPVANFGADPTSGDRPLTVQFADSSSGMITTRLWEFGDGNGSTEQNPVHTYDKTDSFTVTLTVVGPGGTDSKIQENYIIVNEPVPVANFGAEPISGDRPLTVQFADSSTGLITSRLWDFGDGNGSAEQNPVHTYQEADSFTVLLTVVGPGGINTKIVENCIIVAEPTGIAGLYDAVIPDKFQLYQNYPNPFNPSTTIQFGLPKTVHVELSIYNLSGQVVDKLVSQSLAPGSYRYTWEAVRFPSGVYFYKITAGEYVDIKKMIFMK